MDAVVTKRSMFSMQVCVPKEYTDAQVVDFANAENPSGLENGWAIRRQGDEALAGCDERVQCTLASHVPDTTDNCHIMLDC